MTLVCDSHTHSNFSSDCIIPLEEMLQQAIRLGLTHYAVTDHHDPDFPYATPEVDFLLDAKAYQTEVFRLREKYKGQIELLFGVELGLQPQVGDHLRDFVSRLPLDFIIGSSHVVHGRDPYHGDYFDGRSEEEGYRVYFASILENTQAFNGFSVYGHLDYVVRNGPTRDENYDPSDYMDVLEPALREIIALGKGIEVNTSGPSRGLKQLHPHPAILRRYRELGGEIITIGSDAHTPPSIGRNFEAARNMLLDCGFTHYCYFRNLQPVFLPLA